jgi:hypothetical protein
LSFVTASKTRLDFPEELNGFPKRLRNAAFYSAITGILTHRPVVLPDATAHAEVGTIQQAYEQGMTTGRSMEMKVSGKPVCGYCLSDIKSMAEKSGLKSLTIFEEKSGDTLYWEKG